jgi:Aldehyde dehydrogenase family
VPAELLVQSDADALGVLLTDPRLHGGVDPARPVRVDGHAGAAELSGEVHGVRIERGLRGERGRRDDVDLEGRRSPAWMPIVGPSGSTVAEQAAADGGRVIAAELGDSPGYFVAPTVVLGLKCAHPLNQEEVFGPVCTVVAARDVDEAVAIEGGVRQGLVTSLYTQDLEQAVRLGSAMRSGQVRVNAPSTGIDFYAPFGGHKASGIGPKEQGKAARDFFTWTQTTTIRSGGH